MGPEKSIGPFHLCLDRIDGNPFGFSDLGIALSLDDKGDKDFPPLVGHLFQKRFEFAVLSGLLQGGLVIGPIGVELLLQAPLLADLFKMLKAQVLHRLPGIGLKGGSDGQAVPAVPKGDKKILDQILRNIPVLYNGEGNKTQ